jgi:hypothetical protein
LRYLTRGIALSNNRIVDIENGKVIFTWDDYGDGHRRKTTTLDALEFIRRFLLHVVPDGFVHVRSFGLLANRHRAENLACCRALLAEARPKALPRTPVPSPAAPGGRHDEQPPDPICPRCRQGRMRRVETLPPAMMARLPAVMRWDSS